MVFLINEGSILSCSFSVNCFVALEFWFPLITLGILL